jgi:hypothetical protein
MAKNLKFAVASLERASVSYSCSPVVSLGQATEGLCVGEELEANISRFWKTAGECWKGLRSIVILYVIFSLDPSS